MPTTDNATTPTVPTSTSGAAIHVIPPRRVHLGLNDLAPDTRAVMLALRHAVVVLRAVGRPHGRQQDGMTATLVAYDMTALEPAVLWLAHALHRAAAGRQQPQDGRRPLGIRSPKSPVLSIDEHALLNAIAASQAGQTALAAARLRQVTGRPSPRPNRRLSAGLHGLAMQLRLAGCIVEATPLHRFDTPAEAGPWHAAPPVAPQPVGPPRAQSGDS